MNTPVKQQELPFSNVRGIVAVDAHVPEAGAIVWWRLHGTVEYAAFMAAWQGAGLDHSHAPMPCSATNALRRACDDLREKRVLVRPLGREAGFAIVKERVVNESKRLDYDVQATVTLDEAGRVRVERAADGISDEALEKIRLTVKQSFDVHLGQLDSSDFSSWLVRMMPRLDAAGLREQGGVYFVPKYSVDRFAAVVGVLRSVTEHVVNRVPAMRSEDAVDAILDAITQEAEAEAAQLEKVLEEGKLGERGLETRVSRCEEMDAKVVRYESLLGRKLEGLRERLEAIRANLSIAVLKSAKKEDVA